MADNETPKCSVCGTSLVQATFDGSFKFDGSMDLSGMKCPKCNPAPSDKDK